jgi:hypothetical protein
LDLFVDRYGQLINVSRDGQKPFTFLLDRCLGTVAVPNALRPVLADGERLIVLDDHFAQDAKDAEWIRDVGRRRWVIITKTGRCAGTLSRPRRSSRRAPRSSSSDKEVCRALGSEARSRRRSPGYGRPFGGSMFR